MTPRRRSNRLRGNNATPKSINHALNRPLSSLAERDESPSAGPQSTLDSIVSSPLAPRTPATAGRPKAAKKEMHPSKAQQSTTQEPDSGLRFGFVDIEAIQQTPSKIATPQVSSFDFRFALPAPELGPEAQKLRDDLREEALRIKASLAAKREEEKRLLGEETVESLTGRKLAHPKGKVGRFSDVHMAQFKKMDSIAGHPSAFRAQPGRATPTATSKSLKRTQSKAKLDDREQLHADKSDEKDTGRLEHTSLAKRARQAIGDDTSSARPISQDEIPKSNAPAISCSKSTFLASITTPTKASLARATSVKKNGSHIPTLSRSPSKSNLTGTPRGLTKSATTNHVFGSIPRSPSKGFLRTPGKFDRVKSILRHPSSSMKKPTAVPTISANPSRPNLDKPLPSVPSTPTSLNLLKSAKIIQTTPSPIKSGIPRSTSRLNLSQRFQAERQPHSKEVQYPSIGDELALAAKSPVVIYPSLTSPRPLPQPPQQINSAQRPPHSVPGTFSFRSDHTIDFGASPEGFGSSPGQSSVRQVRPSICPSGMPGSFPETNKENVAETMVVFAHGMSNKKRRRADSDDEEEAERSPKKPKPVAEGEMLMAPKLLANAPKQPPTPVKKRGLSLSRLNALARPKMRK